MSTKERILLVDDDVDFLRSTADLLEAHGYRVLSAYDGAAGLELARKERPDLMVLDVMMATKTEGFEIARKIPSCHELRNMPVLLVTGIRREMKLDFQLEPDQTWLPVTRIMEKPIDPAAFVAAVGELLRRRAEMDWKHGTVKLVRSMLEEKEGDVRSVTPDTSVFRAVEEMEKYRVGALLVVERGKLVGICTQRDCAHGIILEGRPAKDTPVRYIMTADVVSVAPDDTLEDCMSLMTHKRIRHLPVVEDGKPIGMIAVGDVVRSVVAQKNSMIEQLEQYIVAG